MFGGKKLSELSPEDLEKCQDDIATLALKEYQAQRAAAKGARRPPPRASVADEHPGAVAPGSMPPGWAPTLGTAAPLGAGLGPGGLGGPTGGLPDPHQYRRPQEPGLTNEEVLKMVQQEESKPKEEKGPMDPAEYRKRQEQGLRPETMNSKSEEKPPPTYEEFLATNFPSLAKKDDETNDSKGIPAPPVVQNDLEQEALNDFGRSQMPAVAATDSGGLITKTIEHYTFADGEDTASFYVQFDKDLWDGASKYIREGQIKVESHATSLEIILKDVPVNSRNLQILAEWRLNLSPLFSKVEPMMTTHKVRNGKLSVKLAKVKEGAWKKGVKYS